MMKLLSFSLLSLMLFAPSLQAEMLVAARTIRSNTVLTPGDVLVAEGDAAGAFQRASDVDGLETRTTLYAGRPIRIGDVGLAAVVERNQIVPLIYQSSGLMITAEGRALGRAAPGERVRVMNLSSRTTLSGIATETGAIVVGY